MGLLGRIKVVSLPDWTYASKTPGVHTFFEAIALAKLENQKIRLTAATQRAVLGYPIFGRRVIRVNSDGTVDCLVSTGFGTDVEQSTYTVGVLREAVAQEMLLRPGTSGKRYLAA